MPACCRLRKNTQANTSLNHAASRFEVSYVDSHTKIFIELFSTLLNEQKNSGAFLKTHMLMLKGADERHRILPSKGMLR